MLNSKDLSKLNLNQLEVIKPHFEKSKNKETLKLINKEIIKKSK